MKAWQSTNDDTGNSVIVYGKTVNEAKKLAYQEFDYEIEYIDIRVNRQPAMDGKQSLSYDSKILYLVRECGWWYELGGKRYDNDNVDELEKDLKEEHMRRFG